MIIGRLHDDLTLVAAREKLCAHARSLGAACHGTLMPAVYRAALTHSGSSRHGHHPPVDFSHDAILYVTVIVIFYAAIIALLVGTNLRRRSTQRAKPVQQLVHFDQKNGRVEHKSGPAIEPPPGVTTV